MVVHIGSGFERIVLLPVVHEISDPIHHVLEDRGPGEDEDAVLRRDKRDDVETGDDPGNLADESEDFDGVHAGTGMSTFEKFLNTVRTELATERFYVRLIRGRLSRNSRQF